MQILWPARAISGGTWTPDVQAVNAFMDLEKSQGARSRTSVSEKGSRFLERTQRELDPFQMVAESGGSQK